MCLPSICESLLQRLSLYSKCIKAACSCFARIFVHMKRGSISTTFGPSVKSWALQGYQKVSHQDLDLASISVSEPVPTDASRHTEQPGKLLRL